MLVYQRVHDFRMKTSIYRDGCKPIAEVNSLTTPPWQDLSGSNCMAKPTMACQTPMFSSTGTKDPASNHRCTGKIDLPVSKINLDSWVASMHYCHFLFFAKKQLWLSRFSCGESALIFGIPSYLWDLKIWKPVPSHGLRSPGCVWKWLYHLQMPVQ